MNILFLHQNFPGQFKFLAPALASMDGNKVMGMPLTSHAESDWRGVKLSPYLPKRGSTPSIHPWVTDFESKAIRAEAAVQHAQKLRGAGFTPDVIIAHPGWGESMFMKEVWPKAKLGLYCEFFYHVQGADFNFDPEFSNGSIEENCRLKIKNLNNLMHEEIADAAISPTHWQASTFPQSWQKKMSVIHDGIDTDKICPLPSVFLSLSNGRRLTKTDEVITFVNRNLEPYRGFHVFMRALPEILRSRPSAEVLIVGGSDVSYGARPPEGTSWRKIFTDEVRPQITDADWSRVHFLGNIPYEHFIPLLQLSTVHIYLTYPFVLSWSLLEAMSAGCAIVASDTAPLHEAIRHGETGRLVPFFDPQALAAETCRLLDDPTERARLGKNAREFAQQTYDLRRVCLPRQIEWVQSLATL